LRSEIQVSRFGAVRNIALAAVVVGSALSGSVGAETLDGALVKAYLNNPDINQQRAAVRAADEEVPKASSGFRPKINAEADSPLIEDTHRTTTAQTGAPLTSPFDAPKRRGFSLKADETLWNADRTLNSVRREESRVMAARERLRNTEQNVLMDGVNAYMNVMRDTAILALDRAHVQVLEERVQESKDRFAAGEVTYTDVAQAEAALAGAQATAYAAQSTLITSIADYRRAIGEEPRSLAPVKALQKPLPETLYQAVVTSQAEHPAILGALHGVDAAALEVKVVEGQLYPTVDLVGLVDRRYNVATAVVPTFPLTATAGVQASAPIYDAAAYASTRQAKEVVGEREFQTDQQRDRVRAAVVSAWGRYENAPGILKAAKALVEAAELALKGTREEAKLGQRTTFDELVAEQALLRARIRLVSAQRDEVVASYAVMSAIGRLSTANLGLAVAQYDPMVHFDQVKDKWFGLRTPDGR
jgi:outer membrane protein